MKIKQIYTDSQLRNFTYILQCEDGRAFVVDPWNEGLVNDYLDKNNLTLSAIINTHEHWDHVQGNNDLVNQHLCEVWAHKNGIGKIPGLSRTLIAAEKIELEPDVILEVIDTPGHSQAHLCFMVYVKDKPLYMFTGDILFNAGVGHCRDGDVNDLYQTIRDKFSHLADDIIIYPGHDYLQNNLNFTKSREPSNKIADLWLEKHNNSDVYTDPLTTTMADERQFNTFLRLNNKEIIENLNTKSITEKDVFVSLRSLRDKW